jgi:hypothetical protein
VAVTFFSERVFVSNASEYGNHWLYIRLDGPADNTTGIGAALYATINSTPRSTMAPPTSGLSAAKPIPTPAPSTRATARPRSERCPNWQRQFLLQSHWRSHLHSAGIRAAKA